MASNDRSVTKIAVVVSHPIQHFCPQYRSMAQRIDVEVKVFFGSLKGFEPYLDHEFGRTVSWGESLLDGFDWVALDRAQAPLRDHLDTFHPDIVLLYGYREPVSRAALLWLTRHRAVVSAYISDTELRHHQPAARRALKLAAVRPLFSLIDYFLSVGDANEAFYLRAGVDPSRIIRMHFPISREPVTLNSEVDRGHLGIAEDALIVLNVGKLMPRKRQMDLVRAARNPDLARAHFLFAGSGPDRQMLEAETRMLPRVSLLGFVSAHELPAYYRIADVYAHPSSCDPHPLAGSEAASHGCALVVSSATGSWGESDDVRPYESGLVHSVGDVAALTASLRLLDRHRDLAQDLGSQARAFSEEAQRIAHGGFLDTLLDKADQRPGSSRLQS